MKKSLFVFAAIAVLSSKIEKSTKIDLFDIELPCSYSGSCVENIAIDIDTHKSYEHFCFGAYNDDNEPDYHVCLSRGHFEAYEYRDLNHFYFWDSVDMDYSHFDIKIPAIF